MTGTYQDLALNVRENFEKSNSGREDKAFFLSDFDWFMHIIRQKFRKEERKQFLEITAHWKISPVLDRLCLPYN